MHQDPWFSYTDEEWLSELQRLDYSDELSEERLRAAGGK